MLDPIFNNVRLTTTTGEKRIAPVLTRMDYSHHHAHDDDDNNKDTDRDNVTVEDKDDETIDTSNFSRHYSGIEEDDETCFVQDQEEGEEEDDDFVVENESQYDESLYSESCCFQTEDQDGDDESRYDLGQTSSCDTDDNDDATKDSSSYYHPCPARQNRRPSFNKNNNRNITLDSFLQSSKQKARPSSSSFCGNAFQKRSSLATGTVATEECTVTLCGDENSTVCGGMTATTLTTTTTNATTPIFSLGTLSKNLTQVQEERMDEGEVSDYTDSTHKIASRIETRHLAQESTVQALFAERTAREMSEIMQWWNQETTLSEKQFRSKLEQWETSPHYQRLDADHSFSCDSMDDNNNHPLDIQQELCIEGNTLALSSQDTDDIDQLSVLFTTNKSAAAPMPWSWEAKSGLPIQSKREESVLRLLVGLCIIATILILVLCVAIFHLYIISPAAAVFLTGSRMTKNTPTQIWFVPDDVTTTPALCQVCLKHYDVQPISNADDTVCLSSTTTKRTTTTTKNQHSLPPMSSSKRRQSQEQQQQGTAKFLIGKSIGFLLLSLAISIPLYVPCINFVQKAMATLA